MPLISQLEELGTCVVSLQVQDCLWRTEIAQAKQEREDRCGLNQVVAAEVGKFGQILDVLEGRTNRSHCHFGLSTRGRREAKLGSCLLLP